MDLGPVDVGVAADVGGRMCDGSVVPRVGRAWKRRLAGDGLASLLTVCSGLVRTISNFGHSAKILFIGENCVLNQSLFSPNFGNLCLGFRQPRH